jgi:hypothetical protein
LPGIQVAGKTDVPFDFDIRVGGQIQDRRAHLTPERQRIILVAARLGLDVVHLHRRAAVVLEHAGHHTLAVVVAAVLVLLINLDVSEAGELAARIHVHQDFSDHRRVAVRIAHATVVDVERKRLAIPRDAKGILFARVDQFQRTRPKERQAVGGLLHFESVRRHVTVGGGVAGAGGLRGAAHFHFVLCAAFAVLIRHRRIALRAFHAGLNHHLRAKRVSLRKVQHGARHVTHIDDHDGRRSVVAYIEVGWRVFFKRSGLTT